MKTPMHELQELIEAMKHFKSWDDSFKLKFFTNTLPVLIDKEKENLVNAFEAGRKTGSHNFDYVDGEYYYNETFKTK